MAHPHVNVISEMEDASQMLMISGLKNLKNFNLPNGDLADLGHVFGMMDITYHNNFSVNHADVAGWAGDTIDLLSLSDQFGVKGTLDEMVADIAENYFLRSESTFPEKPKEGSFSLTDMQGEVEESVLRYIIRDHDEQKFNEKKQVMEAVLELDTEPAKVALVEQAIKRNVVFSKESLQELEGELPDSLFKKLLKMAGMPEDDLYFGTTTFKNGTIVVDPSVKPSTAVFWMFANQTLTFDNVKIVATGVTGTYLINLEGIDSNLNLLNGSEIFVDNTTALDLDIICVNASTGNDIVIKDSKVNVTNLDGRVLFRQTSTKNLDTLRDCEVEYGIVPYPKLDEAQEGYYGYDISAFISIPSSVSDPELVGKTLEMLNFYSREMVMPTYYDIQLNSKSVRDEESIEMLDLIFEGIVCDAGRTYFGTDNSSMQNLVYSISKHVYGKKTVDFASFYAKNVKGAEKCIEIFYKSVDANE